MEKKEQKAIVRHLQKNLKRRINSYVEEVDPSCDLDFLWNRFLFFPIFHDKQDVGFIAYDVFDKMGGIVCSIKILYVSPEHRHNLREIVKSVMRSMISFGITKIEIEFASRSMSKWFQRYVKNEPEGYFHKLNPYDVLRKLEEK